MHHSAHFARTRGFTLIEAIVAIVITGIIAGMVAVFIRSPVEGYMDAARRAELTDIADTAVRRMARDIRLALPNSVRNPSDGSDSCIEFMPTKIGARYRAAPDGATGLGDPLEFSALDDKFDMLWSNAALPADSQIAAGDVVVVYNDGSASGNAYTGSNAIQVASVAEPGGTADSTAITFVGVGAATPFNRKRLPSESPGTRFQVVPAGSHVVAYRCNGGQLTRHTRTLGGAWATSASCAAMVAGATTALLANNLATCSMRYDPPGASTGLSRFGIVSMTLGITDATGETVNLYHQVHVDNTP
ncbi:MAG: type II secretion system protein [Propionivibrio sp.]|uniref:type II secretion system protein n=1 Tax=Propionivibrio sp. TaxID=2212460 RepID=UPI0025F4F755|nr:type II secretion system protein [Propionivibrio sp.]MBL0207127.1 type II secretion system protein [Propionivibrio sp.]